MTVKEIQTNAERIREGSLRLSKAAKAMGITFKEATKRMKQFVIAARKYEEDMRKVSQIAKKPKNIACKNCRHFSTTFSFNCKGGMRADFYGYYLNTPEIKSVNESYYCIGYLPKR
jgi:RNase P subunit RPR2